MTAAEITLPRDVHAPDWWGRFCRLVHDWDKPDRQRFSDLSEEVRQGRPARHVPDAGSIDHAIWDALTSFGYATRTGDGETFELTGAGARRGVFCLLAAQVQMKETGGDPTAPVAFATAFARLRRNHENGEVVILRLLRDFFLKPGNRLEFQNGSPRDKVLELYAEIGAVQKDDAGNWMPHEDAVMNAPFLIDQFIAARRRDSR